MKTEITTEELRKTVGWLAEMLNTASCWFDDWNRDYVKAVDEVLDMARAVIPEDEWPCWDVTALKGLTPRQDYTPALQWYMSQPQQENPND